jgi:hypothetical protein
MTCPVVSVARIAAKLLSIRQHHGADDKDREDGDIENDIEDSER